MATNFFFNEKIMILKEFIKHRDIYQASIKRRNIMSFDKDF